MTLSPKFTVTWSIPASCQFSIEPSLLSPSKSLAIWSWVKSTLTVKLGSNRPSLKPPSNGAPSPRLTLMVGLSAAAPPTDVKSTFKAAKSFKLEIKVGVVTSTVRLSVLSARSPASTRLRAYASVIVELVPSILIVTVVFVPSKL